MKTLQPFQKKIIERVKNFLIMDLINCKNGKLNKKIVSFNELSSAKQKKIMDKINQKEDNYYLEIGLNNIKA